MSIEKRIPTKFMVELKTNLIKEKNLAESSANLYISQLVSLNDKKVFNNLGFLKRNKEAILEHLTQYAEKTELSYLTSIVSSLWLFKEDHLYKTIFKFYRDKLAEKSGELEEKTDPNEKTEKQKDAWISWEEVEKKYIELKNEIDGFKTDRTISKRQFEKLVDYLVLSFYVLIPPRRNSDYMNMVILLKRDGNPLEPEIKNYFDMENAEMMFNIYKTSRFYGSQIEKIPDSLMDVVKIWLKFHPCISTLPKKPREVKLFVNSDGMPQTKQNFITLRLNKIFDGRKIGCSMLRHIYLSHKFGAEYENMQKTAMEMGHSVEEQKRYIKRD